MKILRTNVHKNEKSKIMQFLRESLYLILFVSIAPTVTGSGPFEGTITFIRKSYYDTTELHYYIKDARIRIDKYTPEGELLQTMLVDIEKKEVMAVDAGRKLYRSLHINPQRKTPDSAYEVIKTQNCREINGVQCCQWRVKNRKINSEITYWVTEKNFAFYSELLKLLRQTERNYQFFAQIPGNEGFFPMLSVERTLLRNERERFVVHEIRTKKLNDSLFYIPDDYAKLSLSQQFLP